MIKIAHGNRFLDFTKRKFPLFMRKCEMNNNGCWIWNSAKDGKGYGIFCLGYRVSVRAHRISYQIFVGPIPPGLQLDHLCRVRNCVNPKHLQPVTGIENYRRGMAPAWLTKKTGLCKKSHRIDGYNAKKNSYGGSICRICYNEYMRKRYRENISKEVCHNKPV